MLSGLQEPPTNQSTSQTSAKSDKGKAKMPKYEVDHSNESHVDGSTYLVDNEFSVPITRTLGVKKGLTATNKKLCHSIREKNVVTRFSHNNYMAYHYALMMKVVPIREPESFVEAAQDP